MQPCYYWVMIKNLDSPLGLLWHSPSGKGESTLLATRWSRSLASPEGLPSHQGIWLLLSRENEESCLPTQPSLKSAQQQDWGPVIAQQWWKFRLSTQCLLVWVVVEPLFFPWCLTSVEWLLPQIFSLRLPFPGPLIREQAFPGFVLFCFVVVCICWHFKLSFFLPLICDVWGQMKTQGAITKSFLEF